MFDFLKRKQRSWANMDKFEGRETSSGFPVTEKKVMGIPVVLSCIKVLAESVSALPLLVFKKDVNGDRSRADNFSLYPILHRTPNPIQTSFEWREMMMQSLCLRGNAYAFIERYEGEVVALWGLHPDNMAVEVNGRELLYRYQNDGQELVYTQDEILHIRGLSSDGIMGISPLDLCRDVWGSVAATASYSANFFKNDASPGGILTSPQQLNAQSMANLRESWETGYKGRGNKHRLAVLDAGLEFKAIAINPEQSQMIESRKFDVIEICRIFRVPPSFVQDHSRSTYSNVTQDAKSFLTHTLRPYLARFEMAMEKALLTERERRKYNIEFLTADLLKADTKERFESYKIAKEAGFLSTNEIRKFENLSNIGPDGDMYEQSVPKAPGSPEKPVGAS